MVFKGPQQVITNGNMSGNIISAVSVVDQLVMLSYSFVWTGSPVGSVVVQVSNDYSQDKAGQVLNPGTWNSLPLSASTAIIGAGNGFIDVDANAGYALRAMYISTSGSGTMNAIMMGK